MALLLCERQQNWLRVVTMVFSTIGICYYFYVFFTFLNVFFEIQKVVTFYVFLPCFVRFLELWLSPPLSYRILYTNEWSNVVSNGAGLYQCCRGSEKIDKQGTIIVAESTQLCQPHVNINSEYSTILCNISVALDTLNVWWIMLSLTIAWREWPHWLSWIVIFI